MGEEGHCACAAESEVRALRCVLAGAAGGGGGYAGFRVGNGAG